MSIRLYDAHNHLQDERFGDRQAELMSACAREGVVCMVVNGSCEEDWRKVLELAAATFLTRTERGSASRSISKSEEATPDPNHVLPSVAAAGHRLELQIIPSFGYHPWYIRERTGDWLKHLTACLDKTPSAVGEIGLDRWKPDLPYEGQEEVFIAQLCLASERNLPVSIHCLQVWGRMLEILKTEPRPARGFLLHSYGGPKEMVKPFADLGAYFSLPGYYAHERKERQRETFKHVPPDRLLIETDAPDQSLPTERNRFPLIGPTTGRELNHPANLQAIYEFAAELLGEAPEALAARVEANFLRLFSGLTCT